MRLLFSIDTKDYKPNGVTYVRNSSRCIAIRDHKICLIYSKKNDYYKFPGGGIEQGETIEQAMIREAREEAGLVVIPQSVRPFGYVHRAQKGIHPGEDCFIQDNFYFTCTVEPKQVPTQLDKSEREQEFKPAWVDPMVAINTNNNSDFQKVAAIMLTRENTVLKMLISEGYFG